MLLSSTAIHIAFWLYAGLVDGVIAHFMRRAWQISDALEEAQELKRAWRAYWDANPEKYWPFNDGIGF